MIVMISGSRGAELAAIRMSWIAWSGRSASIASRARSFSASTWLGSASSTVASSADASAACLVAARIWASATVRSRVASEDSAPSSSATSAAIA